MITREQLEIALDDDADNEVYKLYPDSDNTYLAVDLLRMRVPYDECKRIIQGAGHDVIYLCDVDVAAKYLFEGDIPTLIDHNMFIDKDNDCLALFV